MYAEWGINSKNHKISLACIAAPIRCHVKSKGRTLRFSHDTIFVRDVTPVRRFRYQRLVKVELCKVFNNWTHWVEVIPLGYNQLEPSAYIHHLLTHIA